MRSKPENVNHSLAEEIDMLRELVLLINDQTEEDLTLAELRKVRDSLGKASVRLVNLLQVERDLEEKDDPAALLQETLVVMLKRLAQPDE